MATKTTKRKPTLKIGKINPTAIVPFPEWPIEWEKRFTELEQELHRRTDAKTQSGIVYPDNVTTGQDWAKQGPEPTLIKKPKGILQDLAQEINMEAHRIKHIAISLRDNLSDKLGEVLPNEIKNPPTESFPAIEADLRATRQELAELHAVLAQINDLQEVKL